MKWTRSDTIALARNTCTRCHGLGLRLGRKNQPKPCNCVLRAVFRACYAHFRHCATKERYISRASLEFTGAGREGSFTWGRKDEEFMADFILVSRRTLSDEEYGIFTCHFLLGADYRLCCRRLGIDKGDFFHGLYRIEQALGRVFSELEPYSLYPIDQYYNGPRKRCAAEPPDPDAQGVRPAPVLRIGMRLLRSA